MKKILFSVVLLSSLSYASNCNQLYNNTNLDFKILFQDKNKNHKESNFLLFKSNYENYIINCKTNSKYKEMYHLKYRVKNLYDVLVTKESKRLTKNKWKLNIINL